MGRRTSALSPALLHPHRAVEGTGHPDRQALAAGGGQRGREGVVLLGRQQRTGLGVGVPPPRVLRSYPRPGWAAADVPQARVAEASAEAVVGAASGADAAGVELEFVLQILGKRQVRLAAVV